MTCRTNNSLQSVSLSKRFQREFTCEDDIGHCTSTVRVKHVSLHLQRVLQVVMATDLAHKRSLGAVKVRGRVKSSDHGAHGMFQHTILVLLKEKKRKKTFYTAAQLTRCITNDQQRQGEISQHSNELCLRNQSLIEAHGHQAVQAEHLTRQITIQSSDS